MKALLLAIALLGCTEESQRIDGSALSAEQRAIAVSEAAKWCGATQQGFCPKFDGPSGGHRIQFVSVEWMREKHPNVGSAHALADTTTDAMGVTTISFVRGIGLDLLKLTLLHELGHWAALRGPCEHLPKGNVMAELMEEQADHPTKADVEYTGL